MGGVSLSVKEGDSQCTLKVGEGKDDDEYSITRHNQCEWLPKKCTSCHYWEKMEHYSQWGYQNRKKKMKENC